MSTGLLYLIPVLIWGSTWLAIKFQLGVVSPEFSVAYRFLLASILLFIYCRARGMKLRFSWNEHLFILLQGVFLFSVNYILVYFAEVNVTSGLVSVIFSTLLVFNVLFGAVFLGDGVRGRVLLGGLVGIGGLALIFWPELQGLNWQNGALLGLVLALLSALTASLGNIISARNQRRQIPVLQTEAYGMLYGAVLTAIIAFARGVPPAFDTSPAYVASLLYLALFGSVIAFGAYLTLIGRIGPDRAGYVMIMFPVIALLLSAMFEGLSLEMLQFGGVALVLLGNLLVLNRGTQTAASS